MILSPIASALCVKHLVASLCCNIAPHPQRLSLSRWPAGEGGRGGGGRANASGCRLFRSIPLRFPIHMQPHQNPVGKKLQISSMAWRLQAHC